MSERRRRRREKWLFSTPREKGAKIEGRSESKQNFFSFFFDAPFARIFWEIELG